MSYTAFTDNNVFSNPEANIACNRLFDITNIKAPGYIAVEKIALTLNVARIIQGDPVTEIDVIPFITDSKDLFEFFEQNLGNYYENEEQVNFKDRIQIKYSKEIFIEIWLVADMGTVNVIDGLLVQDTADIPS